MPHRRRYWTRQRGVRYRYSSRLGFPAAIDTSLFKRYTGIWIAPGSPYQDLNKTLWAIRHAREHCISCFGKCGGFQPMILE